MRKIKGFFENWPQTVAQEDAENLKFDDLLVLIPAFTVIELTEAFQIGFLLYLPFIAVDFTVSNILLAFGGMMVSLMTISLPFKIILFVLRNGWSKLIHGLVLTDRQPARHQRKHQISKPFGA
jgi:type III secretion protein R